MPIKIESVNISKKKGTIKHPVPEIELTLIGVKGDAHAGPWNRQVSLLGSESIRKFEKETSRKIKPGEFAENITTSGMRLWKSHPLDRFIINEVILEVTQIGKQCHGTSCTIFKEVGNCVMPKEGIFCRVINPGILVPSMVMSYQPRSYKVNVITLSDRASTGEYEDHSGPLIRALSEEFFRKQDLLSVIEYSLIPDDPDQLGLLLKKSVEDKTDIIFTTGGTGIGPRDITPDVISPMLDKEIPGIMDSIRLKYGSGNPNALISRAVAGIIDQSLIFTLPGSVKAVDEYFKEISKYILHLIYMFHGLEVH